MPQHGEPLFFAFWLSLKSGCRSITILDRVRQNDNLTKVKKMKILLRNTAAALLLFIIATPLSALEPVPDKLVVLTFDDSVKSHFTKVRPILIKHGFGATFFITEGFEFKTNKNHYMTWEEIAQLHRDGFEIGNHTRDHMTLNPTDPEKLKEQLGQLGEQLEAINERCRENGIPQPTSFAYPGNGIDPKALRILNELGIIFARRGGSPEYPYEKGRGVAYEPGLDHPLLVPTAGDARPFWKLSDLKRAVEQASLGSIAVLQFHGVPDLAHPWVHTPPERFAEYMDYLADNGFRVIAQRDLAKYVDPDDIPDDPDAVVNKRRKTIAARNNRSAALP